MKKFTLSLAMAFLALATFAQVNMRQQLSRQTLLQQRTLTPDASHLSKAQLANSLGVCHQAPRHNHKNLSVANKLQLTDGLSVKHNATAVLKPLDVQTTVYKTKVEAAGGYGYENIYYDVQIGFKGDKVYLGGLFYFMSDAWMVGTVNADGSLTFATDQYLGKVQTQAGAEDVYVHYTDDDLNPISTFTLTYDAENDIYSNVEENFNVFFCNDINDAYHTGYEVIWNINMYANVEIEPIEIIDYQPEGTLSIYSRAGGAYYSFWGYLLYASQNGTIMNIVTAEDGQTVYMKDIISQAVADTWVKGTRKGNKITVPLDQYVIYYDDYFYGYKLAILKGSLAYDPNYEEYYWNYEATDATEITFTVDDAAGTITMDLQSTVNEEGYADYILGLVYSDDNSWAQYGDYNTVYTLFTEEYETMPEGITTSDWAMMFFDGEYNDAVMVKVAMQADKMYISGLSNYDPDAVMVGTINGDKVTFASDQFLGVGGGYIGYATFGTYEMVQMYDEYYDEYYEDYNFKFAPSATFTFDSTKQILTAPKGTAFFLNAGKGAEEIFYINLAMDPKFTIYEDIAAVPADPELTGMSNWFDDYGYDILGVNLKLEDVNGKYMAKEKVAYILWVKIDGEAEQFTFYGDEYVGLADFGLEEITEIPYSFVCYDAEGYQDIAEAGSNIVIYQTGFDDYGIQTIYYGGGQRTESNIVWLSQMESGVNSTLTSAKAQAIYDLQGRKQAEMQHGLNIVRMSDGTVRKVIVK